VGSRRRALPARDRRLPGRRPSLQPGDGAQEPADRRQILAIAWALYIADREPANVLYAAPNIDMLRDLNSQKLQPLIDKWQEHIRRQVILPQTSRSAIGSTTYEKKFAGGYVRWPTPTR
jgi:hypothetical protein